MITFKDFIAEAKQVGTIFHFTTLPVLYKIISEKEPFTMKSENGETFSASRNASLDLNPHFKECRAIIYIDGDKLSERYKIKPVAGFTGDQSGVLDIHSPHPRVTRNRGEAEEAVFQLPVNIRMYVKHIHIKPTKWDTDFYEPVTKKLDELGITHGYGKYLTPPIKEEYDTKEELRCYCESIKAAIKLRRTKK